MKLGDWYFQMGRRGGGSAYYGGHNRTRVFGDIWLLLGVTSVGFLLLLFLLILVGVRGRRWQSLLLVITMLLTGGSLTVVYNSPCWITASVLIFTPHTATSPLKLPTYLGINIGLHSANISLISVEGNRNVHYNEKLIWDSHEHLEDIYREGLSRGLPFPIITASEALARSEGPCSWGKHYRTAGYVAGVLVWGGVYLWCVTGCLFLIAPRPGARAMVGGGLLQSVVVVVYWFYLPSEPLSLHYDGVSVQVTLGWCCFLLLSIAALNAVVGSAILVYETVYPGHFGTFLEVDFDSPQHRLYLEASAKHRSVDANNSEVNDHSFCPMYLQFTQHSSISPECNFLATP